MRERLKWLMTSAGGVALGFALLVCVAVGQQTSPRPPAAQAPAAGVKFSTSTNLVVVDVTVRDKNGRAVENLKPNDFTVLEDGKRQKISVFEFQRLAMDPAPPPPPPSLSDEKALPEDPKTVITTERPGEVQYHDKRLLVLFFDFSNMGIPEELRAQEAALKYIDTQMTGSDLMAVMLFTTVVQVKTDFTADRTVLKDVINGLPIGELSDLAADAGTGDDNEEDTGAAFVADETEFNIFNTDRKLQAIEDAVHKLASLSEKKVLIYVTGGISKSGMDNQAQLEASINAAVKANVAIYPLDARGLMADPPGGGAAKGASRGSGIFNGSVYNSQRASINNSQETLVTLASDTGGKAFLDSNNLSLGIVQAQQDYRSYYIVGYYTDNSKEDGRWRKITVKLNRDASAKLDYRQGYYAGKVWGKYSGSEKELQLQEALASPDPKTDLPLAVEADYFRISPTAYYVPVSVKIPGSVIALAEKRGGGETQFDFIGQVIDERKTIVGKVRDFIKVKLAAGEAEKLARRNFHYDAGFTLGPGRYRIQFLVREDETGKLGNFDGRFIVPDLTADSAMLKTSSVIWSNQREPLKAAVGTAERTAKRELAANPLILGEEKVVPNVTRLFHRGQNLYVAFDVYDAAPDPADYRKRHVAVSMSLFNQRGMKAFEASPVEATELAATRPNAVPVQLQVPLKGLAPGKYTCQIDVVDQVGRKFAFPRSPIVVQ